MCEVANGRYCGVVHTHTSTDIMHTHTLAAYINIYIRITHYYYVVYYYYCELVCDGSGVTAAAAADGGDVGVLQTAPADFHQVLRRSRDGRASRRGAELATVTNERK